MELESDTYDVVVLGTGLAESLAAASLANSGKSVLHLDPNDYYGAEQASLTLDELATWASARSSHGSESQPSEAGPSRPSTYLSAQRRRYTHASTSPFSPELQAAKRQYAISLFPAVLPGRGPLISTLIDSKVSNYVGFRLLDSVSVWQNDKEDVADDVKGKGKAKRVPGSKEEVFKDKSIGLVEKRRLMKFLLFVAGEFEGDELLKGKEDLPLSTFLAEAFSLPPQLSEQITYAIAHCSSPTEPTLTALLRARRYLKSIGRYGASAFLIGQYGGAGEVAQGFCRACAVKGGTYVLGPQAEVESIELGQPKPGETASTSASISLKIACHPRPITAGHLISSADHLPDRLLSGINPGAYVKSVTAHGVFLLPSFPAALKRSRAVEGEEAGEVAGDDDTAVIVFPPEGDMGVVRGLLMGEGTGSCPAGQFILYLSTRMSSIADPAETLRPYLSRLTSEPLFEAYYVSHGPADAAVSADQPLLGPVVMLQPYSGEEQLTEGLDWEAGQGEKAFWAVMGGKDALNAGEKGWWEREEEEAEEPDAGEEGV